MKYELQRIRKPNEYSANPLRDETVEFESDIFPELRQFERFTFFTSPRTEGAGIRMVSTSEVINIYTVDENTTGFDTETGSLYHLRKK